MPGPTPRPRTPHALPRWLLPALWLALGATLASPAAAQTMVSIDRPVVHMRSGAGIQHSARWQLAKGYPLRVLGRKNGWLKVRDFESDTGWVLGRLTAATPHVVVKVQAANIRSAPRASARLVGRAEYGEVLRTLDRRRGWVRVRQHQGGTGWVARRLLWGW